MRETAKITSKGQVTIPIAIRKRLGVEAGDALVFQADAKGVRVIPEREDNPFEKYRGIGHPGFPSGRKNIIKFIREMRGE